MPSRAYTSFLLTLLKHLLNALSMCQCPLGLIPHFYERTFMHWPKSQLCQCPLGLIPHFYQDPETGEDVYDPVSMPSRAYTSFLHREGLKATTSRKGVNALSGLYLISTDVTTVTKLGVVLSVSMPSRAYTSFLH